MAGPLLVSSSFGEGLAAVRAPRPSLLVAPWLRLEEKERTDDGIPRCGVERGRRVPREWERWCVALEGRNLYGEPILRVVWSEDRTVLVGGAWGRWDDSGNRLGEAVGYRRVPKYPGVRERWVLEMWIPPAAFGTPESWEREWKRTASNGEPYQLFPEFPSRGDHFQIGVFADPETGGYAEPSWADLPGMLATQAAWKEKDPLERYFALRDQNEAATAAEADAVEEAAAEKARELRADTWAALGWRPRVSLAGLDVPRRRIA